MVKSEEEISDNGYKLGVKYESECTGCAQTSIAAIFETLGIWSEDVFKAGSGLADGLGLTGNGSCGALVGSSMAISYLFGRERKDFEDILIPFELYGTCRCHDVQMSLMGRTYNLWDPEDIKEAFSSGMMDHCSKVVGNTVKLAIKTILDAGFEPKK
jgi:hypothetical protein